MTAQRPTLVTRAPRPGLRAIVHTLWTMDSAADGPPRAECVLPTGRAHIALCVSGDPFRLYDAPEDATGRTISRAVVGGARVTSYVKEVGTSAVSVGVLLHVGAASHLFGVPAGELTDLHLPLETVWGAAVESLRDRLSEARTRRERLDVVEAALAERLPRVRGLHPAVAHALGRLAAGAAVRDVVEETGYSHRHFIAVFRDATGLGPKRFSRVQRFRRAVARLSRDPRASHSRVALETGYADQAHLIREFREHAGVTPAVYGELAGARPHHLPLPRPGG